MMRVLVLGSAAGGGFPQWNCRCPVCALAWAGDPRVRARTQSSIAVSVDGENWVVFNASPDVRQQILANPQLHPRHGLRDSPIAAVVITNADVDHIAGLLTLRERQAFPLFATAETHAVLADNAVFAVLQDGYVARETLVLNEARSVVAGISVLPFAVPGKPPLFNETPDMKIGAETEATVGLHIMGGDRSFFYIPGCADVNDALLRRVSGSALLLFDGTTFTDDEMPRLGLSEKTAHRMGHTPISGENGALARFASSEIGRKIFIHINNSNPILIEGSDAHQTVRTAGWDVAFDGMQIEL